MANGTAYDRRTIAVWVLVGIIVLLIIGWLAGVFETATEQPLTEAPETETTTPEPEAEEPAQPQ